jgi:hypothetical protein
MSIQDNVRYRAINQARKRDWGEDATLTIFEMVPETGEAELAEFAEDWRCKRVTPTTDGTSRAESGEWQAEIRAAADWETSQAFMLRATAMTIGDRRWKVKKVEKPIGVSLVWRLKAQMQ